MVLVTRSLVSKLCGLLISMSMERHVRTYLWLAQHCWHDKAVGGHTGSKRIGNHLYNEAVNGLIATYLWFYVETLA